MSLENASLIVTPNAYKAGKLYSVIPQDGSGDFTASRATTATRVNENGLIESVAVNVPRIDYTNGNCPSILVETQRTNLLTYSEEFDNAVWDKQGLTIAANDAISPVGNAVADKIEEKDGDTTTKQIVISKSQTASFYSFSFFFKKDERTESQIVTTGGGMSTQATSFDIDSGTVISGDGAIYDYGNGWYRCVQFFTTLDNTNIILRIRSLVSGSSSYVGVLGFGFYIWGAQLEEGTEASSYIPTTSSAVTRNADVLSNNLTGVLEPTYTAFIEITANDSRLKVEDVDTGFDIPLNGTGKIVMVVDSEITFYFPDKGQPQTTLVYEKPDDFRDLEILSKLNSNSIKLLAIENGVATQTEINNFVSGDITSYFIETDWGSKTNFTDEFRAEDWDYFPVIDTSNATNLTGTWRGNNLVNFPKINVSNSNIYAFSWLSNNLITFPANMFDTLTSPSNSCFLNAWSGNSIDAQGVENILVSIDTSGANAPASGNTIDIDTDGSALTTAATTAVANLKTKGWTIRIDGINI